MGLSGSAQAQRTFAARKALKAARDTAVYASQLAMLAATTPDRQAQVAEATEYTLAAIHGMGRAIDLRSTT